jgi:alpha-amylase
MELEFTNLDLDYSTENPDVQKQYQQWISGLVQEYQFDGLRIDAAKHVDAKFWTGFCGAAGVFCMGEVFGNDIAQAASYTGPGGMDSVLNYPMYNALVEAFALPGPRNVSAVQDVMEQNKKMYKDTTVLGNFLENQDNARWANRSSDPQSLYNAMTFTFMSDG